MGQDRLMTTEEVACYLGVHKKTVNKWHDDGELVADQAANRCRRYLYSRVEKFRKRLKAVTTYQLDKDK